MAMVEWGAGLGFSSPILGKELACIIYGVFTVRGRSRVEGSWDTSGPENNSSDNNLCSFLKTGRKLSNFCID